jgi:hypothetical protein
VVTALRSSLRSIISCFFLNIIFIALAVVASAPSVLSAPS